ncbi:SPRY domain-containing SOCS box protein 3-like [Mytilus californianus]|uniref:SPRY domain-containing SOCS box protein 3-like n=1 Tax=Mytilus californianus TaxID=6549 RepID=UPI00224598D2|nr:SPRY domain-containing SOCS box protein 3-like [Mytilus californianus]
MDSNVDEKQQSNSPIQSDSLTIQYSTSDLDSPISSDEDSINLEMINVKSKGEAFCDCHKKGKEKECTCGEEDTCFEWTWDEESKSHASFIKEGDREVMFHIDYSGGTAAVRGNTKLHKDQYYWEIKMTTPVYGTDMMVGVCTTDIDLNKCRHVFCSMIGQDSDSWGLSYTGHLQHKKNKQSYSSKFGQGSIVGVHLDMWHGTLSFYKNRKPLGIAYTGLQGKILYPVVSSTAARSGMKIIRCCSFPTSLQFMCCQVLRKVIPSHLDVLTAVELPPGLKDFLKNNVQWLLQPFPSSAAGPLKSSKRTHSEEDADGAGPSKRIKYKLLKEDK